MSTIITTPTLTGWKLFANKGILNSLYGCEFTDWSHNYTVGSAESIVPLVNGTSTTTTAFCGRAGDNGMFTAPLTPEEIKKLNSRLSLKFYNTDCSTGEWSGPSPSFTVDLGTIINQLNSITSYSNTMDGLVYNFYNFIQGTIQTRDIVTSTYVDKNNFTTFEKIIYNFNSSDDALNYQLINPVYVSYDSGSISVVDKISDNRWSFPFSLVFNTSAVLGGDYVHGTSCNLVVRPDVWGYWIPSVGFKNITEVEQNPSYPEFYPAIKIGDGIFYKADTTIYPTQNGYIGELYNMFNVDNTGQRATEALANQLLLAAKSNLTLGPDGIYSTTINMTVNIADSRVNGLKTVGNNLSFRFIYNPNNFNTEVITH